MAQHNNFTLDDAEKLLLNTIVNDEPKTLEQRISEDFIFEKKIKLNQKKTKTNTRKRKSSRHSAKKKGRKKKHLSQRTRRKR